ncbi:MAG TPA: hypothetical protein VMV10_05410 [Pirellulales bacterium]|nr:hypothetical protein [Pirellulales bacterium]
MPELNSTVTVLPSSSAAGIVRQQLEAAGIESAVVEADGAFQLRVAEGDFSRAMRLLFPMPSAEKAEAIAGLQAAPWKCAHCGEQVQPTSNVCWSCGKPRAGAAAAAPAEISPPAPPTFPYPTPPAVELPPPPAPAPPPPQPPAETAAALEAAFSGSDSETGKPEALASVSSSMAATPQNQEADASRSPAAPRESSSGGQPTPPKHQQPEPAKPAAASLAGTPRKRTARAPTIEEPNPWREPWLIGIWVFLGLAICLIAWLALR